ncbi:conserved protein of unknown function [Tenacibaculum soleae]|uniref:hypothetical protein n=1 Tax=Tenacibaculum soleae TaxID=447689 RepID=UPI003AB814A9
MKSNFNISELIKSGEIQNELDFQRGKIVSRKLRLLSKESEEAKIARKALNKLLYNYEQKHWADFNSVTDEQVIESEIAEQIAIKELI